MRTRQMNVARPVLPTGAQQLDAHHNFEADALGRASTTSNRISRERTEARFSRIRRPVTLSALSSALKVRGSYAADIRAGQTRPHPRHWLALTALVGTACGT